MTPSILDESFRYVPAAATSVAETWRRFGWRPTTDEERRARRQPAAEIQVEQIATVKLIGRRMPEPRLASAVERGKVSGSKISTA